jgi:hypothetical protein
MNYFIIISVATLVIIAYIHYYGIKSTINPLYYQKPTDRSDTLLTINKEIDKLIVKQGEVLEVSDLDRILSIDHLSLSLKENKRARLIGSINEFYLQQYGKVLIELKSYYQHEKMVYYKINIVDDLIMS